MSELEELPSWAGRSADSGPLEESTPVADDVAPAAQAVALDEPRRRRPWRAILLALLGVLALVGIGAVGFLLAGSSDSSTETATDDQTAQVDDTAADGQLGSEELGGTAESDADAAAADDTVTVEVDADENADAASAGTDTADGTETDAAATTDSADGEVIESGRQAIFKGGKVYLSGKVPSEEVGQIIEQKAAAVVGPDNVVNEYTIDPRATIEVGGSAPLYVEDVVLFEFNSIEIAPPFFPILDLGTLLLRQNPQASVTVITRTDAVGSEAVNLQVSTDRAQSVINYWLAQGVNADQIKVDPRGEEMASDDDDAQAAAMNRRAEFIITGLLD